MQLTCQFLEHLYDESVTIEWKYTLINANVNTHNRIAYHTCGIIWWYSLQLKMGFMKESMLLWSHSIDIQLDRLGHFSKPYEGEVF